MNATTDNVIELPLSEDSTLEFAVLVDGGPVDVTLSSFNFYAKVNRDDADNIAVLSKASSDATQIIKFNATLGIVHVFINPADLALLLPSQALYFQLRITTPDGRVGVVMSGYLIIKP